MIPYFYTDFGCLGCRHEWWDRLLLADVDTFDYCICPSCHAEQGHHVIGAPLILMPRWREGAWHYEGPGIEAHIKYAKASDELHRHYWGQEAAYNFPMPGERGFFPLVVDAPKADGVSGGKEI